MDKNHISQIYSSENTKLFGMLPGGKEVFRHTLCNKNGYEFTVINYGATIISLRIPVSTEEKADVVLGFETLEDYIQSFDLPSAPYFGSIVGRYAGRINNASFLLNGKKIKLSENHNSHQIHGGIKGFSRKFWQVTTLTENENPSITLKYTSKNNEENFPGELNIKAIYTLTEQNELKVTFWATSSEDTIVNLTQHSYFNLDGHSGNIVNQELLVNSNKILETTDELIPTGNYIDLKDHPFDFSAVKNCPTTIDNTFVLDDKKAATLYSKKNKLKMSVYTNQPGVHIYVGGNCFNQINGKENANYHTQSGICFETQNFPDAPNHSHFPKAVLKKGETYQHETTFQFETLK